MTMTRDDDKMVAQQNMIRNFFRFSRVISPLPLFLHVKYITHIKQDLVLKYT